MIDRKPETKADFNKISPTALACAELKAQYTDLPYAAEIHEVMPEYREQRERIFPTPSEMNDPGLRVILSLLEGRHLATNDAIRKLGNCPILELSAGLSSRGLEFSNRYYYIETDLPAMTALKKRIVNQITTENSQYHILPLNPLNLSEFLLFGERFQMESREKPLTIINEGLLMYLSRDEQEQLRDNIASFLDRYSPRGCWITTDLSPKPLRNYNETTLSVLRRVEKETGRKYNRFETHDEVHELLVNGNMKGEPLPNYHLIDKLSCLEKLKITREKAVSVADMWRAWRVTLG